MQYLIIFIVLIVLISFLLTLWPLFLLLGALVGIYIFSLHIRKNKYFKSDEFIKHKRKVNKNVRDYNEISEYINSIPNKNEFKSTNTAKNSHLATYENTSNHNYKRNKNKQTKNTANTNIYSTSLQIVRRASDDPIKYLCKYFNINATEDDLNQLQTISNDISKIENTIENLKKRQEKIEKSFNPPKFITTYFHKQLMEQIGVNVPTINIEYIQYVFEYVSAGGNSSQKSVITFDGPTVDATIEYIAQKIKFKKSVAGQRALMTSSLRTKIKERDNYTCQICEASVKQQSLLLLEIDHIMPLSKGGLSTEENLQTLCWKCNRSKSNKII